ncbi:hypothetical protein MKX01_031869 [Papaver californicum]|nr:hypothetical protein MKX01_031869 [Papaver californicum]
MVPELEKPRVTEIQVRMDCNGCVHKLKKALHGINGIYDIHIDFPQQKLIIIGWADTEKIVKAIRKTRKIIGSVCVHTDEASEAPTEGSEPPPPPEGEQPPPPNTESPPIAENNPQPEPPNDPPPPENPALEIHPSPIAAEANEDLPLYHSMPRDVGEIHVIHHRQRDYNGQSSNYPPENHHGYWSNYPKGHGFRPQPPVYSHGSRHDPPVYLHASRPEPPIYSHGPIPNPLVYSHRPRPEPPIYSHGFRPEPPIYVHGSRPEPLAPVYVTHSYNNYTPTPSVSEYEYVRSPLRQPRSYRMEHYYNEDYYNRDNGCQSRDNRNGNNITSIFSDENPNACRIV